MKVTLTVLEGRHEGKTYAFDRHEMFIVGRSKRAHFGVPDDRYFSRNHFVVEINPPTCFLRDLNSRNGTFVNGGRAWEAKLWDGDTIKAGRTTFRVGIEGQVLDEGATIVAKDAPRPRCLKCLGEAPPEVVSRDAGATYLCRACREEVLGGPQPFPGYTIVREAGEGSQGKVYLATREPDGASVAIKALVPEVASLPKRRKMFLREMESLRKIDHPHAVRYLDMGETEGALYFVMEYVHGVNGYTIATCTDDRLPIPVACRMVAQVLGALDHAHTLGIVHRDVKPKNVLLSGTLPDVTAKLGDFGLARAYDDAGLSGSGLTMTGDIKGSLGYIAPDQIYDCTHPRPAADLYSAAATLYFFLTRRQTHDFGDDEKAISETLRQVCEEPHVPIRTHRGEIPEKLAAAIDRALEKDPEKRFASAAEMKETIEEWC